MASRRSTENLMELLAGVRDACPPPPSREEMLAALRTRHEQEAHTMHWIGRVFYGKNLALRAGLFALLLVALAALALLLPLAGGPQHAARAIAAEGGFVIELELTGDGVVAKGLSTEQLALVRSWEEQANRVRSGLRRPALSLSVETVQDDAGQQVVQLALSGANAAEAAALAELLKPDTDAPARVIAVAPAASDALAPVGALDDPANPYLGQYSEIDRWIYDNAWSYAELVAFRRKYAAAAEASRAGNKSTSDIRYMVTEVDEAGWMKPVATLQSDGDGQPQIPGGLALVEYDRIWREQERERRDRFHREVVKAKPAPRSMLYSAPAAEDLYLAYELSKYDGPAARYPRIPHWLADNPPYKAVLVPNGEVITQGKPGQRAEVQYDQERGPVITPIHDWYRYSPDGVLLETRQEDPEYAKTTTSKTTFWNHFYWPDAQRALLTELETTRDTFVPSRKRGCYWVQFVPLSGDQRFDVNAERTVQAAYAYDGTPLDLDAPIPAQLLADCQLMSSEIKAIHDAQQALGFWYGRSAGQ